MSINNIEDLDNLDDDLRSEEFYANEPWAEEGTTRMKVCPVCLAGDDNCENCDGEGEVPDEDDEGLDIPYRDDD